MQRNLPNRQSLVKEEFAYLALARNRSWHDKFAMLAKHDVQPNNITAIRERKDLTIEQLAERTGLSVGYISRMARGERNISVKNLTKIADALGVTPSDLIQDEPIKVVPLMTWVQAGMFAREDGQQEKIGHVAIGDLDRHGDWIALEVRGDSMDRISPPGSVILVDRNDTMLVPNACYVIVNGNGEITYKRYRSDPMRFEPVSTNAEHETLYPSQEPAVIGRVRETRLKM